MASSTTGGFNFVISGKVRGPGEGGEENRRRCLVSLCPGRAGASLPLPLMLCPRPCAGPRRVLPQVHTSKGDRGAFAPSAQLRCLLLTCTHRAAHDRPFTPLSLLPQLGLVGYVMNKPDGTVEGYAQGGPQALDAFARWLRTEGSPKSRIDRALITPVAVAAADGQAALRSFEVRK
jgi:acylphosphatase